MCPGFHGVDVPATAPLCVLTVIFKVHHMSAATDSCVNQFSSAWSDFDACAVAIFLVVAKWLSAVVTVAKVIETITTIVAILATVVMMNAKAKEKGRRR